MKITKFLVLIVAAAVICGILAVVLIGCAGPKIKRVSIDPIELVSAQDAFEKCKNPDEFYMMRLPATSLPAQVMRFYNCLGIPDMLIVIWPDKNSEAHLAAAHLLMILYVDYNNEQVKSKPITGQHVKTDTLTKPKADDSDVEKSTVSFYKLLPLNAVPAK